MNFHQSFGSKEWRVVLIYLPQLLTAMKNEKQMKLPVRDIFLKNHLQLSDFVSEIEISSFYAINIHHIEFLCPCVVTSFAVLAKIMPYSPTQFYKFFTDIYFYILIFDLFGAAQKLSTSNTCKNRHFWVLCVFGFQKAGIIN